MDELGIGVDALGAYIPNRRYSVVLLVLCEIVNKKWAESCWVIRNYAYFCNANILML